MAQTQQRIKFALCVNNKDCDDLKKGKAYQILPDQILPDDAAAQEVYLRVIDESVEDYLYPESYFVLLELPTRAEEALLTQA